MFWQIVSFIKFIEFITCPKVKIAVPQHSPGNQAKVKPMSNQIKRTWAQTRRRQQFKPVYQKTRARWQVLTRCRKESFIRWAYVSKRKIRFWTSKELEISNACQKESFCSNKKKQTQMLSSYQILQKQEQFWRRLRSPCSSTSESLEATQQPI